LEAIAQNCADERVRRTFGALHSATDFYALSLRLGEREPLQSAGSALHLHGEDRATVDCEYESYYTDPEPVLTFYGDFEAAAIIDLARQEAVAHFGFTDADFFEGFRLKPTPTRLQRLGEAIDEQKRIIAIRYPSYACHAKGQTGYNWAIFPNALGSPDFLRILGAKGAMLEEWPTRKLALAGTWLTHPRR